MYEHIREHGQSSQLVKPCSTSDVWKHSVLPAALIIGAQVSRYVPMLPPD